MSKSKKFWSVWFPGLMAAWSAFWSCMPPHVQYLDQACAFGAGLCAAVFVGGLFAVYGQSAEVIDISAALDREPVANEEVN